MKVISVNIGQRTVIKMNNRDVETGIFKKPIVGPIHLDYEYVRNDVISDRKVHGGLDKAVYGYSQVHYAFWAEQYDMVDNNYGLFGENITFDTLDEGQLRQGSRYALGSSIVEVSKPRQPCFKLGLVFNDPKIIKLFWQSDRPGVYFKVIQPGEVNVGDEMKLIYEEAKARTIIDVYRANWANKCKAG